MLLRWVLHRSATAPGTARRIRNGGTDGGTEPATPAARRRSLKLRTALGAGGWGCPPVSASVLVALVLGPDCRPSRNSGNPPHSPLISKKARSHRGIGLPSSSAYVWQGGRTFDTVTSA